MSSPAHQSCWDHPCQLSLRSHSAQSGPRGAQRQSWSWGLASQFPASTPGTSMAISSPQACRWPASSETSSCPIKTTNIIHLGLIFPCACTGRTYFISPAIKRSVDLSCSNTGSTKIFFWVIREIEYLYQSHLSCSDAVGHIHYVLLLVSPALHPTGALTRHSPMGKL